MNMVPLLYVGFRLTPFIILCFFVLSSMMSSDIRGIIFLLLILFNCFITFIIGNFVYQMGGLTHDIPSDKAPVCNALIVGDGERISPIPLNINIVSFTFAYLVYLMGKYDRAGSNIPTIIFFGLLLLSMIGWEISNACVSALQAFVALILGGSLGVGFAEMVDSKAGQIQYFTFYTNKDVCNRPNEGVFQCTQE